ncbi:MAG: DUF4230 domain-containing protein [Lachnospiraceae bacterium]|nr:DUF4230 domain-containing protein [Lachnospiraceae bacterium]
MENLETKQKYPIKKYIFIAILFIIAIIAIFVLLNRNNKEEKKEIISKASLEKMINVSELSTFEAIYNGVAEVRSDYYVSYEARVKAGIDFEEIDVAVDNETKKIVITLPKAQINEVNVDIASLDYIFQNEKANNETVAQEAYKACIEDVENESADEEAIYQLAEQNAKNIVEALVKPFVTQLDAEYELEIK